MRRRGGPIDRKGGARRGLTGETPAHRFGLGQDPQHIPAGDLGKVRIVPAAAREFRGSAFAGVAPSSDLEWLGDCVDFLVQRDA